MTGIRHRSNTSFGPGDQNETLPHPAGELLSAAARESQLRDLVAQSVWPRADGRTLIRTTGRVRVRSQGRCETED